MEEVNAALGAERMALLRDYGWGWFQDLGSLGDQDTTLIVRRYSEGDRSMGVGELLGGPIPSAFRAVFPGGWRELAEREGFTLPDDFKDEARPRAP